MPPQFPLMYFCLSAICQQISPGLNSIRWILSTCHKILSFSNLIYLSAQLWITKKNASPFGLFIFFLEVSPGIRLGVTNWIAVQGKHNSPLLVLIHRWGGCVAFHLNLIIRKALLNCLCWTHNTHYQAALQERSLCQRSDLHTVSL